MDKNKACTACGVVIADPKAPFCDNCGAPIRPASEAPGAEAEAQAANTKHASFPTEPSGLVGTLEPAPTASAPAPEKPVKAGVAPRSGYQEPAPRDTANNAGLHISISPAHLRQLAYAGVAVIALGLAVGTGVYFGRSSSKPSAATAAASPAATASVAQVPVPNNPNAPRAASSVAAATPVASPASAAQPLVVASPSPGTPAAKRAADVRILRELSHQPMLPAGAARSTGLPLSPASPAPAPAPSAKATAAGSTPVVASVHRPELPVRRYRPVRPAQPSVAERVHQALDGERRWHLVHAYVSSRGMVGLSGTVFDDRDHQALLATLRGIPGVTGVEDNVQVMKDVWAQTQARVRQALALAGFKQVTADVVGHSLYLRGFVPTEGEKERADQVALSAAGPGATIASDLITVKPQDVFSKFGF